MAVENVANAQWGIEVKGYEPLTLEAEEIPVHFATALPNVSEGSYSPSLVGFPNAGYYASKSTVLDFSKSQQDIAKPLMKNQQ